LAKYLTRVAAATLVVAALGTGCGSDPTEREYAVPETLCGLEVHRELYAPLFPPGSDLIDGTFMGIPHLTVDTCEVSVDDEEIIESETSGFSTYREFMLGAGLRRYDEDYDVEDGTPVDGEFDAMVWPGLVIARTPCEEGEAIHSFMIGIRTAYPDDEEESVRVLSELSQPYMRAALDASVCAPDENSASQDSDANE
jgi:hypothetical protein